MSALRFGSFLIGALVLAACSENGASSLTPPQSSAMLPQALTASASLRKGELFVPSARPRLPRRSVGRF